MEKEREAILSGDVTGAAKAMKIPGWEVCPDQKQPSEGAQIVNSVWYFPLYGCDSLDKLVDEWLYLSGRDGGK